ncbi:MAG: HAMP domain-containing histidine kinase [Myxococcaceae bacterium]|nr:HAMP domain-containing histidine kinase [Myxococcaceae bacterium]MCI0673612.1 HAMP domain-containing histidine kinase [Myxococcaceae bacterium]
MSHGRHDWEAHRRRARLFHSIHRRRHHHLHHGPRRLYKRVLLHGVMLLVLEVVAVGLVMFAMGHPPGWRRQMEKGSRYLADRCVELLDEPAALSRELSRMREDFGVELTLYGRDGALLASNVMPAVPPLAEEELALLSKSAAIVPGYRQRVVAPLVGDGTPVGYAVIRYFYAQPDPTRVAAIIAAVFAALVLASIPLAASIVAPLERLTQAARKLGSGDLSARSGLARRDEVGELATAFDEMAARLQALVLREKELLADVSHELRTPLARIRVALEMAAEGDAERAQAYLAEIGVDLAELERLVADVLAAARLDLAMGQAGDGATPLRRSPVQSAVLVERAAERFRSAHPSRPLEVQLEEPLPLVEADPEMLRRVIDNLLDNAQKYSDHLPITLAARNAEEGLVVEVRDRGIGIDPADQERLFTPFFRTDKSRARGTGGVGLGLALARRIVEAHGGRIGVTSAPGQGTTVRFNVPANAA